MGGPHWLLLATQDPPKLWTAREELDGCREVGYNVVMWN